ncbi:MAG: HEPN domain-containing protein [Candidatus Omnitrophica bacterium]|nr:HEPN domain-containing protein [Candidatus Omnitrophota bacterium]
MKPETEKLLQKASRSIRAAERLLQEGDVDFAASRAYYALFYLAEALLNEKDLHSRSTAGFMERLRSILSRRNRWIRSSIAGWSMPLTNESRVTTKWSLR